MRVVLNGDSATAMVAVLEDRDDLSSFCIELPARFRPSPGSTVGPVRFGTATQAWVDRDWLLRAGAFDSPARKEAFEAMIAAARRHGWIDPETAEVAGHVTSSPAGPGRDRETGIAQDQTQPDSQTAKE